MGTEQLPTRVYVRHADDGLFVYPLGVGAAYIRADVVARLVEAATRYRIASASYGGAASHVKRELESALRDARQAMKPTNGKADE